MLDFIGMGRAGLEGVVYMESSMGGLMAIISIKDEAIGLGFHHKFVLPMSDNMFCSVAWLFSTPVSDIWEIHTNTIETFRNKKVGSISTVFLPM